MDYEMIVESRRKLSFSEANILRMCIKDLSKADFLYWMDQIVQNTKDELLRRDAESLVTKILPLGPDEYLALKKDTHNNTVIFPPNYKLPVF